jgi:serine protease AprX
MKTNQITALFVMAAAPLLCQEHKLSGELQSLSTQSNVQVIVQYKHDPTNADHQRMMDRGGQVNRVMHSIQAGSYSLPANALAALEEDPNIAHVSMNHKIKAKLDYVNAAINAPTARQSYGVNGAGIGVAVIDSGLTHDTDFGKGARIVYQYDFLGGNGNDHYGHGQHVAAIIAGDGSAAACSSCTRNLGGIAPGANILNLRVLDDNGETDDSTLVAAIDMAIQLKSTYNVRVINLSVGRPIFESYTADPLCQAAEAAWKAGIVVVVAAGNEGRDNLVNNYGYGTITSPGNDPYVITVGAMKTMETYTRTDDLIASYSSKGPTLIDNIVKPDLVAPGNRVVSSLAASTSPLAKYDPINLIPTSYYDSKGTSAASSVYYSLSGTSMAAAVVSGAVADLLEAQPALTPDQVKARLMQTAYKTFPTSSTATDPTTGATYISYYDIFTRGAGYLDLNAA